ncbi:hypothetical protein [Litchfieldia salsa]|uniref:Uncharacterized protein n=1 Tax=Litchfieldia salsa TaxID=930152 RepID=A0A1H0TDL9_9BACI|nr:hypothetical protein [Litchfieldia salsa]SDP51935.1 hypothetical protein SAMN05216565_103432 [Litchfieldia salsa]
MVLEKRTFQDTLTISEKMVARYFHLSELEREIEKEMKELKKVFHLYFDETSGTNQKAEFTLGDYKLQRQIRLSENYDDEKTVTRLEERNLKDCIQIQKKPDIQKIEAAITLGLIDSKEVEDCKIKKISKAISVKRI